jgi:hypothetical protein
MPRSTSKSDQPLRLRNAQKSKAGVRSGFPETLLCRDGRELLTVS